MLLDKLLWGLVSGLLQRLLLLHSAAAMCLPSTPGSRLHLIAAHASAQPLGWCVEAACRILFQLSLVACWMDIPPVAPILWQLCGSRVVDMITAVGERQ